MFRRLSLVPDECTDKKMNSSAAPGGMDTIVQSMNMTQKTEDVKMPDVKTPTEDDRIPKSKEHTATDLPQNQKMAPNMLGIDPIQIRKIRERNELLASMSQRSGVRGLPASPATVKSQQTINQTFSGQLKESQSNIQMKNQDDVIMDQNVVKKADQDAKVNQNVDKVKKWMNTEIEEVSSSSHSKSSSKMDVQSKSRQRSQSLHKLQGLGLQQVQAKTQMEKPKTDSEGSGRQRSSKTDSLYKMYNTQMVRMKKNLNVETQSATQKVKKRIQEKLRISSSVSCSQRNESKRNLKREKDDLANDGQKDISM